MLNISHCQFGDEHIASLIKNLTSLELFHAESTALFSIDNAREKLETRDLKELALSPNWGPPPIWADFLEEYQHVDFENKLCLNDSKTEFMIVGTRQQLAKVNIDSYAWVKVV